MFRVLILAIVVAMLGVAWADGEADDTTPPPDDSTTTSNTASRDSIDGGGE